MSVQSNKQVAEIELEAGSSHKRVINLYVSYDNGKGPGYDDGKVHRRGYLLHAQPELIEPSDTPGVVWRSSTGWSGRKAFIEEAKRYSAKRHGELADNALSTDLCRAVVEEVVRYNNLKIAAGQPFAEPAQASK